MSSFQRGDRVQIINPRHRCLGKPGVVVDLNRGNVTVRLDDGTEVVTRMSALGPAPAAVPASRGREAIARRASAGDPLAILRLFIMAVTGQPSLLAQALRALPVNVVHDALQDLQVARPAFVVSVAYVSIGSRPRPSSAIVCFSKEEATESKARLALLVAKDEVASMEASLDDGGPTPDLVDRLERWSRFASRLEDHVAAGEFGSAARSWDSDIVVDAGEVAFIDVVDDVDFGAGGLRPRE